MARPLRIQYENAYYHVTCRGNARARIFLNDYDRKAFIDLLQRSGEIYQVDIIAFVLMSGYNWGQVFYYQFLNYFLLQELFPGKSARSS